MECNGLIKYVIIGCILYAVCCLFTTNIETLKRLPVFVLIMSALVSFRSTFFSPFQEFQKEKVKTILDDLRLKLNQHGAHHSATL